MMMVVLADAMTTTPPPHQSFHSLNNLLQSFHNAIECKFDSLKSLESLCTHTCVYVNVYVYVNVNDNVNVFAAVHFILFPKQ